MGVLKPDLIMKSVIPVVMAGILGIYGMIVAVILLGRGKYSYNLIEVSSATDSKQGYAFLAGGLCCGLSSLVAKYFFKMSKAAGLAIGIVGDAGVRANA
jgi:V-type H+-transporting ATPase proteolipid subunit